MLMYGVLYIFQIIYIFLYKIVCDNACDMIKMKNLFIFLKIKMSVLLNYLYMYIIMISRIVRNRNVYPKQTGFV